MKIVSFLLRLCTLRPFEGGFPGLLCLHAAAVRLEIGGSLTTSFSFMDLSRSSDQMLDGMKSLAGPTSSQTRALPLDRAKLEVAAVANFPYARLRATEEFTRTCTLCTVDKLSYLSTKNSD